MASISIDQTFVAYFDKLINTPVGTESPELTWGKFIAVILTLVLISKIFDK